MSLALLPVNNIIGKVPRTMNKLMTVLAVIASAAVVASSP